MELLLLLPILWSIRNLLNNCRNVFKSLWVQPKIFEIGVSWVFIIAIHIQLFFSLFLKIYDGLGFLRRKIRCMSLSLAIVICWVWQFWHPFEIVEKLPLWQSDICEMEPSPCPVCRRTILRRFFGRQENIFLELFENGEGTRTWGAYTLLVIYYLLSCWPAVWPPLLVLGRGGDSTPAFI